MLGSNAEETVESGAVERIKGKNISVESLVGLK
jgi:hypothetical protein